MLEGADIIIILIFATRSLNKKRYIFLVSVNGFLIGYNAKNPTCISLNKAFSSSHRNRFRLIYLSSSCDA